MTSLFRPFLKIVIFGIVILMFFGTVCFGQTKNHKIDQLLELYLEYGKFNGSVLVANHGKVIYKKGFGWANMEWDIANEPDTKHRLGSISKQFTAMIILQLASEDKLDLHAPITTYLVDYPKKNGDRVTTHHLLTHTAGIPSYTSFPGFFANDSRDPYKPKEFVEKFKDKDLEFTPGEKFNYSNSGYFLLGVIIEEITGKSYEKVLKERIFKPLGMNDSGYDTHAEILKNRATGYEKNGNEYINASYLDMSIPYAAGSLYSTVEDLYLWDQALYSNALLSQEYMDLFFKPQIPAFGSSYYAYGWTVQKEPIGNSTDSIDIISHGGGINGFNTIISRSVTDQSLVVLLNNTGGAPLIRMARSIRAILNDKSYDLPKKSLAFELLQVIKTEGIVAGEAYFNSKKDSDELDLREGEMNQIGYQLMGEGQVEEAAEVFKWNMNAYPKSFNTYDSYAEALMNLEDKEGAIKYYKISIEMNPANQNGIDMLKKLGENTDELEKEVVVPNEILESYLGDYELAPGFILTISKEGTQMKAQATGQPMLDIFPKSNEVFYLKAITAQITFNKDSNGEVESLTLLQGGQKMVGKRVE